MVPIRIYTKTLVAAIVILLASGCGHDQTNELDAEELALFGGKKLRQIEAGPRTTCLLMQNGTLTCKGTTVGQNKIPWYRTFTRIAVSQNAVCGLREGNFLGFGKGKIACYSQDAESAILTGVPAGSDYTQIIAGWEHICALKEDTLTCWGIPCSSAQNGTCWSASAGFPIDKVSNENQPSNLIAERININNVVFADAEENTTCFIKGQAASFSGTETLTGPVACFGDSLLSKGKPPLGTYSKVVVGGMHNCAILAEPWQNLQQGKLVCWGAGSETANDPNNPRLAAPNDQDTYTDVMAGWNVSCARTTGGNVTCWGPTEQLEKKTYDVTRTGSSVETTLVESLQKILGGTPSSIRGKTALRGAKKVLFMDISYSPAGSYCFALSEEEVWCGGGNGFDFVAEPWSL